VALALIAVAVVGVSVLASTAGGAVGPAHEAVAMGTAPAHNYGQAVARCRKSEVATGGGFEIQSINPDVHAFQSVPLPPDEDHRRWRWAVTVINESDAEVVFTAHAVCAPA
jgi:hypothetical protein